MDDLLRWRSEFPILEEKTYMLSNSLGAMPRRVLASLREYAQAWSHSGIDAWEKDQWWEMPVAVGDLVGGIIGAPSGTVSMHQNVTLAEAIAFSALRPTPERNRVVYSELNFSSIRYFYQAQPELEVCEVPSSDGVSPSLESLLEAIDERTLVVPISHVIFLTSALQQVEPIIEKAHSVGAMVILDLYQSCGAVPIDVSSLEVDFAIGGSIKWLCGGPGVAYLYVRPDHLKRLEPRLTGWIAHEQPFDFEPRMRYAPSAFRFLNGTPNIPGLYAARSGYQIIAEVGVEKIRQKSLRMTARILELADEFGFQVHTPRKAERRGGHVSVDPPGAAEVCRRLNERGFVVDFRPGAGIRVAPHFYNTMEEVEATMREMKRLVEAG